MFTTDIRSTLFQIKARRHVEQLSQLIQKLPFPLHNGPILPSGDPAWVKHLPVGTFSHTRGKIYPGACHCQHCHLTNLAKQLESAIYDIEIILSSSNEHHRD